MTQEKTGKRKLFLIVIVFIILAVAITLILWPHIKRLAEPETRAAFEAWVRGLGIWGVLVMFGLQVLQIIISFIPGEPVEIISGLLYGGFGGMLICLAGCAAASTTVFMLTRRFGSALVKRAYGEETLNALSFLRNAKRLETIVFLLFLIPGAKRHPYLCHRRPEPHKAFHLPHPLPPCPYTVHNHLHVHGGQYGARQLGRRPGYFCCNRSHWPAVYPV